MVIFKALEVLTMVQILPIKWTRAQFERRYRYIITNTQKLIGRSFPRGNVDEEEFGHHWWLLINRLLQKGDIERDKWMSHLQV